jgi:ubiquinone/menaquinone biosynthesis C-methylase UbiE
MTLEGQLDASAAPDDPYAFAGDRLAEERRLIEQSRLFEPFTEECLREAGLGPGMHVVDLGSGAGDMAILAARLVGPTGSVLGIERSSEQADLARRRVAAMGLDNVTFDVGDVAGLDELLAAHRTQIDAVIGRLILMWVPQRHAVLAACARALRPGTLVCFLEPDLRYDHVLPSSALWETTRTWVLATLDRLGAELRMGPRLHQAFREAGLPAPSLRGRTIVSGAEAAPVWFVVNVVRALVPHMETFGLGTSSEVDIETLEDRLRAELEANDGVMFVPPLFAAWTRVPG